MMALALAILASFSISLLVKDNEAHGVNTQVVLASNYISASLLGWGLALIHSIDGINTATLALGLVGGVLWPGTFYLLMWGIRRYGLSLAGSISRLSLSVPVLFAVLFLGERLTLAVALGIAGTFLAFLLLNPAHREPGKPLDRGALVYFPVLVLAFGIVDLWVNLFNTLGPSDERFLFMVLIFTASMVFAWGAVFGQRRPIRREAVLRGLLLGIPNFASTYFLLESLKAPVFAGLSAVVYALYSVLGVTLAFAAGALLWRERVTRRNLVGVGVAIAAIVLLNLG